MSWAAVQAGLEAGLAEGVATAAALVVGRRGEILFQSVLGRLDDEPEAPAVDEKSLFDLASLTKPLAATLACLGLVQAGRLELGAPLGRWLDLPPDKAGLTPAHLLAHTSGLPAWRPFYRDLVQLPWARRQERLAELVARTPLEGRPGRQTVYSDLGFILLTGLIEELCGQSLAEYLAFDFYLPLGLGDDLGFVALPDGPGPAAGRFVASERCPWRGRLLRGEVNDENAWAAGGLAGQAGLFGTPAGVFRLMDWLAASAEGRAEPRLLEPWAARLILERPFPDQPRRLGFDVAAPENPAAGRLARSDLIGHLGFTGTSLWHRLGDGLSVVLLTNRTIFGRDNDRIRAFRPLLHDLVDAALRDRKGRS